jgi:hypothetical protein
VRLSVDVGDLEDISKFLYGYIASNFSITNLFNPFGGLIESFFFFQVYSLSSIL